MYNLTRFAQGECLQFQRARKKKTLPRRLEDRRSDCLLQVGLTAGHERLQNWTATISKPSFFSLSQRGTSGGREQVREQYGSETVYLYFQFLFCRSRSVRTVRVNRRSRWLLHPLREGNEWAYTAACTHTITKTMQRYEKSTPTQGRLPQRCTVLTRWGYSWATRKTCSRRQWPTGGAGRKYPLATAGGDPRDALSDGLPLPCCEKVAQKQGRVCRHQALSSSEVVAPGQFCSPPSRNRNYHGHWQEGPLACYVTSALFRANFVTCARSFVAFDVRSPFTCQDPEKATPVRLMALPPTAKAAVKFAHV